MKRSFKFLKPEFCEFELFVRVTSKGEFVATLPSHAVNILEGCGVRTYENQLGNHSGDCKGVEGKMRKNQRYQCRVCSCFCTVNIDGNWEKKPDCCPFSHRNNRGVRPLFEEVRAVDENKMREDGINETPARCLEKAGALLAASLDRRNDK